MKVSILVFGVLMSVTACKKDSVEDPEEFPELGTCMAATPGTRLTFDAGTKTYNYETSGGGNINIEIGGDITFSHKDYEGFKIELWGGDIINGQGVYSALHENLKGKHIKDKQGNRRTIIFPDGAKFTMVTDGERGKPLEISIYDDVVVHHINPVCNTLELSTSNLSFAKHFDAMQADGEASIIEITSDHVIWANIYTEDVNGNKVEKRELLGELTRDRPTEVRDYFDDPRLGHT